MQHTSSIAIALLIAFLSGCKQPAPVPPVIVEPTPTPAATKPSSPPTTDEQEVMATLAGEGAQALAGLGSEPDVAHGATWLKGSVPSNGSTAYLLLGKLGVGGASTLRFVVRCETPRGADLSRCSVFIDGNEAGSFSPAPNKFEKSSSGAAVQLADVHFDDVRSIVLAMINGRSAIIQTADGSEIRLGRSELEEMQRVLSAYLHLQAQP